MTEQGEGTMAEITREQAIDYLSKLSVMDLVGLTKELETKWGVSAAPVAVAAVGGGAAPAAAEAKAEEKTEFAVELTGSGDKKIQVIKAVREITNLGLAEAKALVEGAPKVLPGKEAVSKAEADELKKKLEE